MQGVSASATDTVSFACPSSSPSPTPSASASPTPSPPPGTSPSPTASPAPNNCVSNGGASDPIRNVRVFQFTVRTTTSSAYIAQVVAHLDSQTQGVPSPADKDVTLVCPTGDEDASTPGCQSSSAQPRSGTYSFVWDSNAVTPYNGTYRFRVDATFSNAQGGIESYHNTVEQKRDNLIVDNFPQQPDAPRIVVATASTVSLAWNANPEPDILSYTVKRAVTKDKNTPPADSQFKVDFTTTGTTLRDPVKDAGAYWYRVSATRRSIITPETGITSVDSQTSAPAVVGTATPSAKPGAKSGSQHVVALPPPPAAVLTPPGLIPSVAAAPPPVPDAPFSAYLPYQSSGASEDGGPSAPSEAGASTVDPRGAVLPVAVGAFLVSSALALGRMPF